MASGAQLTVIGINAAKPFLDNSDYWKRKGREVVETVRRKSISKFTGERPRIERDSGRRRSSDRVSERGGGGDRGVRPRGGFVPDRSKSLGADYSSEDDYYRRRSNRGRKGRRRDSRAYDAYESEGSVPPRSRQAMVKRNDNENAAPYGRWEQGGYENGTANGGAMVAAGGAGAAVGAAEGNRSVNGTANGEDESTSSDSSSVIDSEEDERQEKKKRRAELVTGGIAAIATLNAAANVYGSMKLREGRQKQIAEGTISKEDAKKQRYKHHIQDAAAIGIAAICVKGAYAKWQGTVQQHRETREHKQQRKERREKRMRKGVSRYNHEEEREAAARMGRSAPGYEGTAQVYANGDAPPARPSYNRRYSRSLDDVRAGNYYPDYDKHYRRSRGYRNGNAAYEYEPADGGYGAYDGGDGGE